MYSVGQTICNGSLVVASIDSSGNISAVVPADRNQFGAPLTISYSPAVTEALILSLAQAVAGA